jgi:hypothetical protein
MSSLIASSPLSFGKWQPRSKFESIMQYKIELKVRNHNTLSRQLLIDTVVSCVPSGWTVNLEDAEVFFLVEVFKVRSLLLMECMHEKEHC